jgi:hypothetical protein
MSARSTSLALGRTARTGNASTGAAERESSRNRESQRLTHHVSYIAGSADLATPCTGEDSTMAEARECRERDWKTRPPSNTRQQYV